MPDPSNAIYSLLTSDVSVSALVSTRVYPNRASQGATYPYVTFTRISSQHVEVLGGSFGLNRALFQIDSWSKTYDDARDIAEKVRLAIQGFSGTAGAVAVDAISLQDDRDRYFPPTDADERGIHSVSSDYDLWHSETVPTFP